MVYAIILDIYQKKVGDDQFAVSYSGTLEKCETQTNHDGGYDVWQRSDFTVTSSKPWALEGSNGSMDEGQILGLEPVYGLVSSVIRKFTIPVAAGVAAGLAIGRMAWSRGSRK